MTSLRRTPHVLVLWSDRSGVERVTATLAGAGFEVYDCTATALGLKAGTGREIDAALVDVDGPGDEGLADVARLQVAVRAPIVSVGGDVPKRRRALDAGAVVALPASIHGDDLARQLRALLRLARPTAGGPEPDDGPGRARATSAAEAGGGLDPEGLRRHLTGLEWRVFSVLTAEPHRFFTSRELLELVWGYSYGSVATVSVHIHRLRQKLEAQAGAAGAVETVRGRGYVYLPPPGA